MSVAAGACVAGASLAADSCAALVEDTAPLEVLARPRVKKLLVGALAASGFAYQRVLGYGEIPFFVRLPLLPLSVCEACLANLAVAVRAADVRARP